MFSELFFGAAPAPAPAGGPAHDAAKELEIQHMRRLNFEAVFSLLDATRRQLEEREATCRRLELQAQAQAARSLQALQALRESHAGELSLLLEQRRQRERDLAASRRENTFLRHELQRLLSTLDEAVPPPPPLAKYAWDEEMQAKEESLAPAAAAPAAAEGAPPADHVAEAEGTPTGAALADAVAPAAPASAAAMVSEAGQADPTLQTGKSAADDAGEEEEDDDKEEAAAQLEAEAADRAMAIVADDVNLDALVVLAEQACEAAAAPEWVRIELSSRALLQRMMDNALPVPPLHKPPALVDFGGWLKMYVEWRCAAPLPGVAGRDQLTLEHPAMAASLSRGHSVLWLGRPVAQLRGRDAAEAAAGLACHATPDLRPTLVFIGRRIVGGDAEQLKRDYECINLLMQQASNLSLARGGRRVRVVTVMRGVPMGSGAVELVNFLTLQQLVYHPGSLHEAILADPPWWLGGMLRPLLSVQAERLRCKMHTGLSDDEIKARLGDEAYKCLKAFDKD